MGDYDINFLNYEKTPTQFGVYRSTSFKFINFSLINKPTRVKKDSVTLINDIFTNFLCDIGNAIQGIIYTDISDHFSIIHINYSFQATKLDIEIMLRNMSQRNKQAFCHAVSEIDWGSLYNFGSAQKSITIFLSKLSMLYKNLFLNTLSKISIIPGNYG